MEKLQIHGKIKPDLFNTLPSEIIIDILSRLPIRSIVICKSVCRSWRDLLCSRYFIDFHLSKSVPGLIIDDGFCRLKSLPILEYDYEDHDVPYKLVTELEHMISTPDLHGSANGLLLLSTDFVFQNYSILRVCNPITREYIELRDDKSRCPSSTFFHYGFGVSRTSRQYKVVSMLHCFCHDHSAPVTVYTLGTGVWRTVTTPASFQCEFDLVSLPVCVNGNLHWLAQASDGAHYISCFDLETETFSTFSLPPIAVGAIFVVGLVLLGDCLCVCDNGVDEIVIWLMKEYGNEKSWTKEFVIKKSPGVVDYDASDEDAEVVHPIKVFRDGDALMAWQSKYMFYYDNKAQTIKQIRVFEENVLSLGVNVRHHSSSFFSLSSFVNERVSRF